MRYLVVVVSCFLACADDTKYNAPQEEKPPVVGIKESSILAADPNLKFVVIRHPGGPGKPDICSHAILHSKETAGGVTKGVLTVFDTFGQVRMGVPAEQGAATGKWNETFAMAGCP
jgi:hypothetical protein